MAPDYPATRKTAALFGSIVLTAAVWLAPGPAHAQVQPEPFSYPVGLNPYGDNFLALRSLPSSTEGVRLAKLGPDTLFAEIERRGDWVHIRLLSGDTGWVSARYVGCCRTIAAGNPAPAAPEPDACADLWYRRNSIYKAAGFCFKSMRGREAFSNEGCQFDDEADVPLSVRQRAEIADLARQEDRRGCQQR